MLRTNVVPLSMDLMIWERPNRVPRWGLWATNVSTEPLCYKTGRCLKSGFPKVRIKVS